MVHFLEFAHLLLVMKSSALFAPSKTASGASDLSLFLHPA